MYNLTAYAIYGLIVCTVIVYVGHYCYRHGAIYLAMAFPRDTALAAYINKLLLVGYYLLNLGVGIYLVSTWSILPDAVAVAVTVVRQLSNLLFLLGTIHYFNLFIINYYYLKHSKN